MSNTAQKEAPHQMTDHLRSQAVITPAETPDKAVDGGSVTNIVIKPMAEDDQDSVYEQIKRKYMKEQ